MKKCNVQYFKLSNGRVPVLDFVNSLDLSTQRKYFYKIELLETFGKQLPEPHAKHLVDGIYELRFRGVDGAIRVLYFFFTGNKIVMTNAFKKKTDKVSKKEVRLAYQRRNTCLGKR